MDRLMPGCNRVLVQPSVNASCEAHVRASSGVPEAKHFCLTQLAQRARLAAISSRPSCVVSTGPGNRAKHGSRLADLRVAAELVRGCAFRDCAWYWGSLALWRGPKLRGLRIAEARRRSFSGTARKSW